MKIPPNHTEDEVLTIIEKVVCQLAGSFTFGCWDLDDIKQFGRLKCLELLAKGTYDPSRPLEAYLFTHVRRRYLNLRRDEVTRYDPPCPACASNDPCEPGGCQRHNEWKQRNTTKANLQRPLHLDHVADEPRLHRNSEVEVDAAIAESLALIDRDLPIELRADYLRMRDGVHVPKERRLLVEEAVKEILRGDVCPTNEEA